MSTRRRDLDTTPSTPTRSQPTACECAAAALAAAPPPATRACAAAQAAAVPRSLMGLGIENHFGAPLAGFGFGYMIDSLPFVAWDGLVVR